MAKPPWLTVVTVVLNDHAGLRRTLASVSRQEIDGVEHIVIDGQSTDGTLEVLRAHQDRLSYVSEPDDGIYDAMNKGIHRAAGTHIHFLNAGDTFASDHEVEWLRSLASGGTVDWIRARARFVDRERRQTRALGSARISDRFRWGWQPVFHQGSVMSRDLLLGLGGFDPTLRVAADHDLMRRAWDRGTHPVVSDRVLVDVAADGVSTQQWSRGYVEIHRARTRDSTAVGRVLSGIDLGAHIAVTGGRRLARRAAELITSPERLRELRFPAQTRP